jgi:serine/threonine-protein kinase
MNQFEGIQDTYEIREVIGDGGGGKVYKAYHKRLQKIVVIKEMKEAAKKVLDTRTEADLLKELKNQYIPQVLDYIEMDGNIFTVMEYISGDSFQKLIDDGKRFSQKNIIKWAVQLCEAVAYLHGRKNPVIHGDIKPDNLMLTPEGNICLIDFNISGSTQKGKALVSGYTNGYSPPEQYAPVKQEGIKGKHSMIDARSDIYSIGATLYFILTGIRPEASTGEVTGIDQFENVNEGLAYVIAKAMQKEPEKRFQSAGAMLNALKNINRQDRRYKRFVLRKEITYIVLIILMASSAICANLGYRQMHYEKNDVYEEYMLEQEKALEKQDYEKADEIYEQAVRLYPRKASAYYYKALSFYYQEQYEECREFTQNVLKEDDIEEDEDLANWYFVTGNCCFEMEQYEAAVKYFNDAIVINKTNPEYYRDFAIALARCDNMERARNVLERGIDYGIRDEDLYLVEGELYYLDKQYGFALENLENCLKVSQNDYVRMRAYLILSNVYDALEKENSSYQGKNIECLNKAINELPVKYTMNIMSVLAEKYTQDEDYGNAIRVYQQIVENGWSTYTIYCNIAALYLLQEDYSSCRNMYEQTIDRYGENYEIYKRLAFMEAQLQATYENSGRNYQAFQEYYQKAESLYVKQLKNNNTDTEMQLLEQMYQDVISGGWLQ